MPHRNNRGWRNNPTDPGGRRHGLSARGIKNAPTKATAMQKSMSMNKKVNLDRENWGLEYEKGKYKLRLGNLTTAGWYWTGDNEDLNGYIIRLRNSRVTQEFQDTIRGKISWSQLKKDIKKSIEKGDGIYEISGDNQLWHFGHGEIEDEEQEKERLLEEGYSPTQADKIIDEAYNHFNTSFDEFNKENGKEITKDMLEALQKSQNLKEYMEKIEKIDEDAIFLLTGYGQEKFSLAVDKAINDTGEKPNPLTTAQKEPGQRKL